MPEVIDPNVCAGLFGPCSEPVTHHMEDPDGDGPPIHLCDKHWDFAMDLEKALGEDPEFANRFAKEVRKAERSSIPTRYKREPVI
jgi:hypothetical protein